MPVVSSHDAVLFSFQAAVARGLTSVEEVFRVVPAEFLLEE